MSKLRTGLKKVLLEAMRKENLHVNVLAVRLRTSLDKALRLTDPEYSSSTDELDRAIKKIGYTFTMKSMENGEYQFILHKK